MFLTRLVFPLNLEAAFFKSAPKPPPGVPTVKPPSLNVWLLSAYMINNCNISNHSKEFRRFCCGLNIVFRFFGGTTAALLSFTGNSFSRNDFSRLNTRSFSCFKWFCKLRISSCACRFNFSTCRTWMKLN